MTHAALPALGALSHLHPDRRSPAIAAGALLFALALVAPAVPAAAGWLLWTAGALMLGVSLVMLTAWVRAAGVAAALVATTLGLYLALHGRVGASATTVLLAAALSTEGGFLLALSQKLRPLKVWPWLAAASLGSLTAAALLGAGLPDRSPQAIALLLAGALGSAGAALVALGLARPAPPGR